MNKYIFILAACAAYCAHAEGEKPVGTTSNSPALTPSASGDFWKNEVGGGFQKGASEVGISGEYAIGGKFFGTSSTHNFVLGAVRYGKVISDVVAEDKFYAGNWEVLGEMFGGFQVNTTHADLAALTGVIRYNFVTGTRFVPFIQGGAGVMYTDIGGPDLGSDFQFVEQAGIGLHCFITKNLAATVEGRLMHISNAGISSPNRGVNTIPLVAGLSYFF